MAGLTVALMQLEPHADDVEANRLKGDEWCRRAQRAGAELAVFPEMWSHGYQIPDPPNAGAAARWRESAVASDGPFVAHFAQLARELDMAIAITYLERYDPQPRNSVTLFDRHGRQVLHYAKVHTCDFDREALLTPGDGFAVGMLDTGGGPVQIGAMICYDREFPESARVLMLAGAELVLVPNACEMEANRMGQLHARAFENMMAVALTNYPSPWSGGRSVALDGIAFDGHHSHDMVIVEGGGGESIYQARFDLGALRQYRASETWGNAYRKPGRYAALTSSEVAPPFVRGDSRRG
ncbi:MAG: carbon-nitrogen hydrolase family protein [Chloroflexi bacterium]|nr:carbon-nitrogen hydrolase family protein [Chloroflexota bacterium]